MMLKTSDNRDRWHMYSLDGIYELNVFFIKMIPVILENALSKGKQQK